jgi:hypothetical protein
MPSKTRQCYDLDAPAWHPCLCRGSWHRLRMQIDEVRWLGCVVCGDDSEFVAVEALDRAADAEPDSEDELMCTRCGQARLVPILGMQTVQRSA